MKLYLYHGRHAVDEEMDDWGFDGPTLEDINHSLITYATDHSVGFKTRAAMLKAQGITGWKTFDEGAYLLQVPIEDGMIETKDGFFGDWEFQDDDSAFWDWRCKVDMWADRILGLKVEDIEGTEVMLRTSFADGEKSEEYVTRIRDH